MIENVFRHARRVGGKRVVSRVYSGRYALSKGERPVTVALDTPDRDIARKRLRALVLEKQREREGLIAPKAQREAATQTLAQLVEDYRRDLVALGRAHVHVRGTVQRIGRIIAETGWKQLVDATPETFIAWRSSVTASAKTKKEYQASVNAFFNWLEKQGRIARNPLDGVAMVETRGKQVRESRAFTADELRRLFKAAPARALVYQTIFYTGARKEEVRALVWGDLHLDDAKPFLRIRETTTKDKEERIVPLHPMLAAALRAKRPVEWSPTGAVFERFPLYETLRRDLERADIEHRDALGRVVHFHAFRKTFQTLGASEGINQRSAQAILGHSDPNLTAKAYTDAAALPLHAEVAKLPWLGASGDDTQLRTQKSGVSRLSASLPGISNTASAAPEVLQVVLADRSPRSVSLRDTEGKVVVGDGFEPSKGGARLIYSQIPLATWVTYREKSGEVGKREWLCQALS